MSYNDSAPITVTTDVEGVSSYLNTQAQTIADQLSTLRSQLAPLIEAWAGQASTYYQGLQQEWDTAAAGLFAPEGVLGQIAQAMGVAWGNYSNAEYDNTRTWQSAG